MAHALGGTVERAREPEIGWHPVVSDLPEVIAEGPWMQWHYDVVTVPPTPTRSRRPRSVRRRGVSAQLLHAVPSGGTETMIRRWASSDGGSAELLKYG
jgi:hypothetical protein